MRPAEIVFVLFLLCCCGAAETGSERVFPVTVTVAEASGISRMVMAPGFIEAGDQAVLAVPVPARVTGVIFSEGDPVQAGDTLLSMVTDAAYGTGRASALAAVSAAEILDYHSRDMLSRTSALYEAGAASLRDYEQAQADARAAGATLASARAALARAAEGSSAGVLTAPFSGRVTRIWAGEGNPASGPLIALSGEDLLQTRVMLPQRVLPWLEPGLPAFYSTFHHPGRLFPGTVCSAASSVDMMSGLVAATVLIEDPEGLLLPGMSGMVSISLEFFPEALSLPRNAFVHLPDGSSRVMVVEKGVARERAVETGLTSGYSSRVLAGISPGDSVIILGNLLVSDGDRVRVEGR